MSSKVPKKEQSYFLRTQSSILKGEKFIPFSSLREKVKKKNKSSVKKKKGRRIKKNLTEKNSKKQKNFINDICTGSYSSFRGIDLNKVSGYHSPKKLNTFSETFQKKENDCIKKFKEKEINEQENKLMNDNKYVPKYHKELNLNYDEDLNNNKLEVGEQQIENHKYDRNYYLNNNENINYLDNYNHDLNNKEINNNLNNDVFNQNKVSNSMKEKYINSQPTKIKENEIINYQDESKPMNFNQMDIINNNNYFNNKVEFEKLKNNNQNKSNEILRSRLNNIFFAINKLNNNFKDKKEDNNVNVNIYNKYKNNNKKRTYYYSNNKDSFRTKILNNENRNFINRNYQ